MRFDAAKSVEVHLRDTARKAAARCLYRLGRIGWWCSYNYKGPFFVSTPDNQVSVAVGHSTVNVRVAETANGITQFKEYVYPMDTVGRVKITN